MNGTKIRIDTGSEGPRHDPYHYSEITVERLGHTVTIHRGLGVWLERDEKLVSDDFTEEELLELFEQWTGMSMQDAERYQRRSMERCPNCGRTEIVALGGGYVGETLYGCARCQHVLYDDFRMSMIE